MAKILVADDSAFMRTIVKNILAKGGYKEIVEATNGNEVIEKFNSEKPDLTLLDIIMEEKDGLECLKEIMKTDPNAKVIIVSAMGQEQMVKEAAETGAKEYIVKPFKKEKVLETVKKTLG